MNNVSTRFPISIDEALTNYGVTMPYKIVLEAQNFNALMDSSTVQKVLTAVANYSAALEADANECDRQLDMGNRGFSIVSTAEPALKALDEVKALTGIKPCYY